MQNFGNWMKSRQTTILAGDENQTATRLRMIEDRGLDMTPVYPIHTRPLIDSLDDDTILALWTLQLKL